MSHSVVNQTPASERGLPDPPNPTPAYPVLPSGVPDEAAGGFYFSSQPQAGPPEEASPYNVPPPVAKGPLWYLGAAIVDPELPAAPLGTIKVPGYNPAQDYEILIAFCTRTISRAVYVEPQFAATLFPLTIEQRDALNDYTVAKSGMDLVSHIDRHIGTDAKYIFRAVALGPLGYDVDLLRKALSGSSKDGMLLIELLLFRPQEELRLLIGEYKRRYGKDLADVVKAELSGKFEKMIIMALDAGRPSNDVPVDLTQVGIDVAKLYLATSATKDEDPFIDVFVHRSHPHLAKVVTEYARKHGKSLSKVVKKTFSRDLQQALLYILHGAKSNRDGNGIWRDAKLLEDTMAGMGTRDRQLVYRVMRAHWNARRFEAIKAAYLKKYGRTLEHRIKGDTSGHYRDMLLYVVRSTEPAQ